MKKNMTTPLASAALDDVLAAMDELLHGLDLSRPLVLPKNEREIETNGKTAFRPSDFVERVDFDRFEIEVLYDDDRRRRSNDPRNDFSNFGL